MSGITHWHYVAFAYAAAVLVVAGLLVAILADYRAQIAALARLEAKGARRHSAAEPAATPRVPAETAS